LNISWLTAFDVIVFVSKQHLAGTATASGRVRPKSQRPPERVCRTPTTDSFAAAPMMPALRQKLA